MLCFNNIIGGLIGIVGSYLALTTNYGNIFPAPQITSIGCEYSQYYYNLNSQNCNNLITGTAIPNSTVNLYATNNIDTTNLGSVNYGTLSISNKISVKLSLQNSRINIYNNKFPENINIDGTLVRLNNLLSSNIKQLYIQNDWFYFLKDNNDFISIITYCENINNQCVLSSHGYISENIIQVAFGYNGYGIALKTNGRVIGIGNYWNNFLPTQNNFIKIFGDKSMFCAIDNEGTVIVWSLSNRNQYKIYKNIYPNSLAFNSNKLILKDINETIIGINSYLQEESDDNDINYLPKKFICNIQVNSNGIWQYRMTNNDLLLLGTSKLLVQSTKNGYTSEIGYGQSYIYKQDEPTSMPTSRPTVSPTIYVSSMPTNNNENFNTNNWIDGCYKKFTRIPYTLAPWCIDESIYCNNNYNYGFDYSYLIVKYFAIYSNKVCQYDNLKQFFCWENLDSNPYKWKISNEYGYDQVDWTSFNQDLPQLCKTDYIKWNKLLANYPNSNNAYLYFSLVWTEKLKRTISSKNFNLTMKYILNQDYHNFENTIHNALNIKTPTQFPTSQPSKSLIVSECHYYNLNTNFYEYANDQSKKFTNYVYLGLKLKGYDAMRIITRSLSHVWYYDKNKYTIPYFSMVNNTINSDIELASNVCAGIFPNSNKYIASAESWLQFIKYTYPDNLNEIVGFINSHNHNGLKQVLSKIGKIPFPTLRPSKKPSFRPSPSPTSSPFISNIDILKRIEYLENLILNFTK